MRVIIDTNVILSAILFPESIPAKLLEKITENNEVVLTTYIIEELHNVFKRKFKNKIIFLERFLSKFSYELVHAPIVIEMDKYQYIRDKADLPILVSAMIEEVDCIITGDKDFQVLTIEKPKIISSRDFYQNYI
ncbi:MAG: putative toxin-antitoxin system toxin component, PIN family [Clostridiales bacterium GWE2_32_10]|nr:MAG: putative toxin-antitoxin system toxin component, PIN family [Clostridiales bacterium GWE2_32_10]HBY20337.1 putative toxin-antitoxin system toxin component, PIN family [Clostridiales bacterium]